MPNNNTKKKKQANTKPQPDVIDLDDEIPLKNGNDGPKKSVIETSDKLPVPVDITPATTMSLPKKSKLNPESEPFDPTKKRKQTDENVDIFSLFEKAPLQPEYGSIFPVPRSQIIEQIVETPTTSPVSLCLFYRHLVSNMILLRKMWSNSFSWSFL